MRGDGVVGGEASRADGGVGVVELARDPSAPGNGGMGNNGGLIKEFREERSAPGMAGRAVVGGG